MEFKVRTGSLSVSALLLVFGLTAFGANAVITSIVLFSKEITNFSDKQVFSLFANWLAVFYLLPLFAGYMSSRVLDSMNSSLIGLAIMFIGQVALALDNNNLLAGLLVYAFGGAITTTNLNVIFSKNYRNNSAIRTRYFILAFVASNAGAFLGGFTFGLIKLFTSYQVAYIITATCYLFSALILFIYRHSISGLVKTGQTAASSGTSKFLYAIFLSPPLQP